MIAGEAQVLVTVGESEPRIDSLRLQGDDEVTVAVSFALALLRYLRLAAQRMEMRDAHAL